MKNTIIIYLLLLPLSVLAQTDITTVQKSDSVISEKGNLHLLTERISRASKAYKTGIYDLHPKPERTKSDSIRSDSITRERIRLAREEGWIYNSIPFSDKHPQCIVVFKGKQEIILTNEELNNIPSDSISSIELLLGDVATAIYGTRGSSGVMFVRLKED